MNEHAEAATHHNLEEAVIERPLNHIAEAQATEVERIWPTPEGQDPVLRQVAALTEEVGEIARAVLKRSHASRSADGTHKGKTADEWTENLAVEVGQALGVLLGLAHQEGMDLDGRMADTLDALRRRPSIIPETTCGFRWTDPFGEMNECGLPPIHDGPHTATWALGNGQQITQPDARANGSKAP